MARTIDAMYQIALAMRAYRVANPDAQTPVAVALSKILSPLLDEIEVGTDVTLIKEALYDYSDFFSDEEFLILLTKAMVISEFKEENDENINS